jgi:putative intracellular protease/amidase
MSECTALVPVADGSEEIETVAIVDTLVRAGVKVTLASVSDGVAVKCSRGVKICADVKITDVVGSEFDCIALPGGTFAARALTLHTHAIGDTGSRRSVPHRMSRHAWSGEDRPMRTADDHAQGARCQG